jgi:hypothetical protein
MTWDDVQHYENRRKRRDKMEKAQAKEWKQNQKKMGPIPGYFAKYQRNSSSKLTMENSEIDTASYISGYLENKYSGRLRHRD